jgi:DNA-binding response OmpR family regulator
MALAEAAPVAILLDLGLPTAWPRSLRAPSGATTPVIVLSAPSRGRQGGRQADAGADDYLTAVRHARAPRTDPGRVAPCRRARKRDPVTTIGPITIDDRQRPRSPGQQRGVHLDADQFRMPHCCPLQAR